MAKKPFDAQEECDELRNQLIHLKAEVAANQAAGAKHDALVKLEAEVNANKLDKGRVTDLEKSHEKTLRDVYWLIAIGAGLIGAGVFNVWAGKDKLTRDEANEQVKVRFEELQGDFEKDLAKHLRDSYDDLIESYSNQTLYLARYITLSGLPVERTGFLRDLSRRVEAVSERIKVLQDKKSSVDIEETLKTQRKRAKNLATLLTSIGAVTKKRGLLEPAEVVALQEIAGDRFPIHETLAQSILALSYVAKSEAIAFSPEAEEYASVAVKGEYQLGLAYNVLAVNRFLRAEDAFQNGQYMEALADARSNFQSLLVAAGIDGSPQAWFRFHNNYALCMARVLRWHVEQPGGVLPASVAGTIDAVDIVTFAELITSHLQQASTYAGSARYQMILAESRAECLSVIARYHQISSDAQQVAKAGKLYADAATLLAKAIERGNLKNVSRAENEMTMSPVEGWIAAIKRRSKELVFLLDEQMGGAGARATVVKEIEKWIEKNPDETSPGAKNPPAASVPAPANPATPAPK